MNDENNDIRLRQLLREWPSNQPLPPRFEEQVWRRIETAEQPARHGFPLFTRLSAWLSRPGIVTACAALFLLIGLGTGYLLATHDTDRWETQLSHHYALSLTPYAADKP